LGTASDPITFTSSADSGPGEWGGITFLVGTGHLRHAVVRYAGAPFYTNIVVDSVTSGQVVIESSQVVSVAGGTPDRGLRVVNSHVVVSDTTFAGIGDGADDYALYLHDATSVVTVTGSAIRDNGGYGIFVNEGQVVLAGGSTVRGNGSYGIYVNDGQAVLAKGSVIQDNGLPGIYLGAVVACVLAPAGLAFVP